MSLPTIAERRAHLQGVRDHWAKRVDEHDSARQHEAADIARHWVRCVDRALARIPEERAAAAS